MTQTKTSRPLFRNEVYCDFFLKILERVRRRYRLVVLGYVVMPEHVHLLVSEPQRGTLSTAVQALKLGLVRSLLCSGGSVVAAPRSRKSGETWGTLNSGTLTSGTPVHPEPVAEIAGLSHIRLYPEGTRKRDGGYFERYREAWELLRIPISR
jgi:hypothetical protein